MISYIKKLKRKIKEGIFKEMWLEAKWMYQYARKYRFAIFYYIVLGILGTGMGLAGSVASKYLIDTVTGFHTSNISFIIAVVLSMALGNIIIGAITSRISTKISIKVNNEIQADIYDAIMRTDWEALSQFHSGDLLNRLNGDGSTVADSVLGWIPSLITRLLQFSATLVIILYYDSTMAVIALLSAPVTMIMSRMLVGRMRNYNKKMRQVSSEMMSFNEESFQNIQTIKSFDLINLFGNKLKNVQKNYADNALDYNKFSIYTSSFMSLVGIVVTYATFGWGVYRLWSRAITYGTMTLFLQLSGSLSSGFSSLVGMVPSAIGATTSAGRVMAIIGLPREKEKDLNRVSTIDNGTQKQGLTVQLTNINFYYKNREKVVQDVTITAKPQEIIAITGASGEGKTTLLRIILGLLNPSVGEAKLIDVNGLEVSISSATRRFIAYVPQGNTIFSGTIADNLRMVKPEATEEEMIAMLKAACAYDFIEALPEGIYTKVGEKGVGFSEGQAQRISIARALLRDAPILLLDEATSALDIVTEKEVLRRVMAFGKKRTCILITHRQSVLSMCDRVYHICEAQVKECKLETDTDMAANF